ncbi:IS4 family transposase, partial [Acetivibrio clariflavus]
YIMLAVENRNNTDLRTIGTLFYYCCDELEDIKFHEALQLIIEALKTTLQEKLLLTKETVNEFLNYFVTCLPVHIKAKLSVVSCES